MSPEDSAQMVDWRHPDISSAIISESDASFIRELFESKLKRQLKVELFTAEKDCRFCGQTEKLLKEISAFTKLISLEVYSLERDEARADGFHIDQAPTTVIHANNGTRLYYLGLPAGNQVRAITEDIVDASEGTCDMFEATRQMIKGVERPLKVDVFVTPSCPYSPIVVRAAHRLAIENPNIRARMVEIMEFPDMALKYNVLGVPKIVIDDNVVFDGPLAEGPLAEVLAAVAASKPHSS